MCNRATVHVKDAALRETVGSLIMKSGVLPSADAAEKYKENDVSLSEDLYAPLGCLESGSTKFLCAYFNAYTVRKVAGI